MAAKPPKRKVVTNKRRLTVPLMSQREYAFARGVTPSAVWQAIQAGRLPVRPDGRVDPAEADKTWYRRFKSRMQVRQGSAESEARREHAVMTTIVAKVSMTRQRFEKFRAQLVERDKGQAEIGGLIGELYAGLPHLAEGAPRGDLPLLAEATGWITADLGDLHGEALKVTQQK